MIKPELALVSKFRRWAQLYKKSDTDLSVSDFYLGKPEKARAYQYFDVAVTGFAFIIFSASSISLSAKEERT